jgi:oligoendopeptidase F
MAPRTIPKREDIPHDHKWDLTSLFHSDEDWDKLFAEIENRIDAYTEYKGRLKEFIPMPI